MFGQRIYILDEKCMFAPFPVTQESMRQETINSNFNNKIYLNTCCTAHHSFVLHQWPWILTSEI